MSHSFSFTKILELLRSIRENAEQALNDLNEAAKLIPPIENHVQITAQFTALEASIDNISKTSNSLIIDAISKIEFVNPPNNSNVQKKSIDNSDSVSIAGTQDGTEDISDDDESGKNILNIESEKTKKLKTNQIPERTVEIVVVPTKIAKVDHVIANKPISSTFKIPKLPQDRAGPSNENNSIEQKFSKKFDLPPPGIPCAFCGLIDHHYSGDCPFVEDPLERMKIADRKLLCRGCGHRLSNWHSFANCTAINGDKAKTCHHCKEKGLHWQALCPKRHKLHFSNSTISQNSNRGIKRDLNARYSKSFVQNTTPYVVQKKKTNVQNEQVNETLEKIVDDLKTMKAENILKRKANEKRREDTIRKILAEELKKLITVNTSAQDDDNEATEHLLLDAMESAELDIDQEDEMGDEPLEDDSVSNDEEKN
ncbi:hypothetical protein Ddc_09871 [Ditylenchus destructor]|nr:hypothetical protein Ddc_09871 [Ditylenchus destructor]